MDQQAVTVSPQRLVDLLGVHAYVSRGAIPYWVIVALVVALTILAINYASIVAERDDYLELVRVYGLGCNP